MAVRAIVSANSVEALIGGFAAPPARVTSNVVETLYGLALSTNSLVGAGVSGYALEALISVSGFGPGEAKTYVSQNVVEALVSDLDLFIDPAVKSPTSYGYIT